MSLRKHRIIGIPYSINPSSTSLLLLSINILIKKLFFFLLFIVQLYLTLTPRAPTAPALRHTSRATMLGRIHCIAFISNFERHFERIQNIASLRPFLKDFSKASKRIESYHNIQENLAAMLKVYLVFSSFIRLQYSISSNV